MPTFTETQLNYLQNKQVAESTLDALTQDISLGQGYALKIWFNRENAHPRYRMIGPNLNINHIPPAVLVRYYRAVTRLRDWENDRVNDFPTFADIRGE